jgi:hypothetical protein
MSRRCCVPECSSNYESEMKNNSSIPSFASFFFNRMIVEELTEYLIVSQIDVQVRQVLDRLWSSLM